ncbi:NADH-ubiquinone oxidoreductase 12 kDa subunit [Mycena floridula]|nr:NADH-ubiquinone oxidoreductase 12 kDa subunit [Mycena floridula]
MAMTAEEKAARQAEVKVRMEARDNAVREAWVRAMEARLVRQELDKCHRAEGVNHYENCKWLQELYLKKLKATKERGQVELPI